MAREIQHVRGKVVLITGAARGFGELLARDLAEKGAELALLGLEPERLHALARELGPNAEAFDCDVRDRAGVDAAVAAAAAHFGGIDVTVANAGITAFGTLADLDPDRFEAVLDVNVNGVYRTLRATYPHLATRRGYALVVASMAAAIHSPLQAHYCASKAAVTAMADSLRIEGRADGVGVGCLHPTFASTDLMTQTHDDPAGDLIWGGNKKLGLWSEVPPEQVVRTMVRMITRRSRRAAVPDRLLPVVWLDGLVQPLLERGFTPAKVRRMRDAARR
jgi:NAD(P)-dependent dehydrogenase (short-subunit alcohol dehydrogenase family)